MYKLELGEKLNVELLVVKQYRKDNLLDRGGASGIIGYDTTRPGTFGIALETIPNNGLIDVIFTKCELF